MRAGLELIGRSCSTGCNASFCSAASTNRHAPGATKGTGSHGLYEGERRSSSYSGKRSYSKLHRPLPPREPSPPRSAGAKKGKRAMDQFLEEIKM